MIPLVKTSIPARNVLLPELEKVLYSGYVAQGEIVDLFESDFQEYIGSGYSLSLNSGTAALHIALILAGVKQGDEVISTPLTAEPTNVAIKMLGALIRYADIDPKTGNICPDSIEKNINEKTKAIIVVDYAGIPVNVQRIQEISKKQNIPVIEDAAHALGAKYKGVRTGNHFPLTVFSFQAIKHLTTIDGGILQIGDKNLFEEGKIIRWFGLNKSLTRFENNIKTQGYKYHMNNVNAAIGRVQMRSIDALVNEYIDNGKFYDEQLKGVANLELLEYYTNSEPSYWLYTMKVKRRDDFIKMMNDGGVAASELHKRSDSHDFLNDFNQVLPNLDEFYSEMVHIPCGWWVNQRDREKIVSLIKQGW